MSLIFHLFFLCLILSMTSCAGKSDYHFKDSADALKQYRDFHHSIAEEHQANAEKLSDIRGEIKDIAWGSQIRSYFLQPYQLVKDLRTGVEIAQADSVLDGNIDPFINAYLKWDKTETAGEG